MKTRVILASSLVAILSFSAAGEESEAEATAAGETMPTSLEAIDTAGVAALARNDTQNLRLINVWATWCAPCVREFPGLVSLSRRLGEQELELVTISVDDPGDQAKVREFLEKQHAAMPDNTERGGATEERKTSDFLFTGADTDGLAQALDSAWRGAVPHTVAVAPGGKVVYRHTGEVDIAELEEKLVEELGLLRMNFEDPNGNP